MNLIGLHDREALAIAMVDSWIVDTIALSENPAPQSYASHVHWFCRANWGYGSTGTLPTPNKYDEYVARLADYVRSSSNCRRWIIGNEPNLPREWPDGKPIYPRHYADCYRRARTAIKSIAGHESDEVLIAGSGPWNAELKYPGNPTGDWVQYFLDVIGILGDEWDGAALHAYTHGYDPALVQSEAKMNAPFENRHYEFRTYQDYLAVIPAAAQHKPCYITEANGDGAWQATGLMLAMVDEINAWNQSNRPTIRALVFYRYPKYDQYHIEGKQDVIDEYKATIGRGYTSPVAVGKADAQTSKTLLPHVVNLQAPAPDLPRDIDPRLKQRGVTIETPTLIPGEQYWRIKSARWFDEKEAQGRHHIYADALVGGTRIPRTHMLVKWPSGSADISTEAKPGEPYGANFPMSPSRNEFSIQVSDPDYQSETLKGIGMGAETPGGFNAGIHTSTGVVFELAAAPMQSAPVTPQPPVSTTPALAHPVRSPAFRTVTQPFGARPDYYKRFAVDGVALNGHNGIDFATPIGTPIVAVDDGQVVEVASDPTGFGKYIKLVHSWGESLYAHLDGQFVSVGDTAKRGQWIANSGYSGNVIPAGPAGAHLHFGLRVNPFNRRDGWGGYVDPAPYLQEIASPTVEPKPPTQHEIVKLIYFAAIEFNVDPDLLLSLAWYESRFDPNAISGAGAHGLMQIMPATWAEWSAKINAGNDPFNAQQSARVGAAYLRWCLDQTYNVPARALIAYNWGLGNLRSGREIPLETRIYAYSVAHGADFVKAIA